MPVIAGMSLLAQQIEASMNLGPAAQPPLVATLISAGVASVVPMGLFPSVPPIPLIPAGMPLCQSAIQSALSLGPAATPKIVSLLMASGISMVAPMAPPAGLSLLATGLENAMGLKEAATQKVVAQLMALEICNYYPMGGII